MFGFGKKASYEERIREAFDKNQLKQVETIAREAFADPKAEEQILAWVAGAMFEREISSGFDLLSTYVNRFPNSLHLPRVYLADLLSRSSRFDEATHCSRYYLRLAKDSGVLSELSDKRIIRDGVSRSFLLLTSAYTTIGARSYSKRILNYGMAYDLSEHWRNVITNELAQLDKELQIAENETLDKNWEQFFSTGIGADELYNKCNAKGFPQIAKRIDLLEGNFRFNQSFIIDTNELFMIVVESKEKQFALI